MNFSSYRPVYLSSEKIKSRTNAASCNLRLFGPAEMIQKYKKIGILIDYKINQQVN